MKHTSVGSIEKNEAPLGRILFGRKWGRGMREVNRIQGKAQKKNQLWRLSIFNAKRYCDSQRSDPVKNLISRGKKRADKWDIQSHLSGNIFLWAIVVVHFSLPWWLTLRVPAHYVWKYVLSFLQILGELKGMCPQKWKLFLTFLEVYVPLRKGNWRQKKTDQIMYATFKHTA